MPRDFGNKILIIFYFLLGLVIGGFSFLEIIIQANIWTGDTESATVIAWTQDGPDHFVELEFFNKYDSLYYTVKKQVRQRSVDQFKDKEKIDIRYSRLLPSSIRMVGMSENDFIIEIIGVALGGALCFGAVLVLRNRLKIDDFV